MADADQRPFDSWGFHCKGKDRLHEYVPIFSLMKHIVKQSSWDAGVSAGSSSSFALMFFNAESAKDAKNAKDWQHFIVYLFLF